MMKKVNQLAHAKRLRKALSNRIVMGGRLTGPSGQELEGEELIAAAKDFWAADDEVERLRKGSRP